MNITTDELKTWLRSALFIQNPSNIAVIDKNYNIIEANNNFKKCFGDWNNKKCYEVYKKISSPCDNCRAMITFKDGKIRTYEEEGLDVKGNSTHYIVHTLPVIGANGKLTFVIERSQDITHVKLLEKEKIEAERLAAVGQTVAGLAHSVKNILMGVEGGMYIVGSGIKKDKKEIIAEGWDMLQRNIEKVTSLVKDFLSFAKGRKLAVKMTDPGLLIDEIISLYHETAKATGVELEKVTYNKINPTPLDLDGIHTCLTNLISNAIDACQASSRPDCKVKVGVYEKNNIIIFEVSDNGCGLDYDVKQKVFTTFFTTKGGKGTGLGLLTTRKIIQEHGGKIFVESEPEKGSLFRIELPRNRLLELLSDN